MGNMDMNAEAFALAAANLGKLTEERRNSLKVIDAEVLPSGNINSCNHQLEQDKKFSVQLNFNAVANIVSDVCGVLQEISRTVGTVMIENQRTQQVKVAANVAIRQAKEQTTQVRIQETEATKRIRSQYIADIRKAEINLKKELKNLENEKEELLSDERKFNKALDLITDVIQNVMAQNRLYMQSTELYSDELHKNNEKLIQLVPEIIDLYIGKRN